MSSIIDCPYSLTLISTAPFEFIVTNQGSSSEVVEIELYSTKEKA